MPFFFPCEINDFHRRKRGEGTHNVFFFVARRFFVTRMKGANYVRTTVPVRITGGEHVCIESSGTNGQCVRLIDAVRSTDKKHVNMIHAV